MKPQITVIIRTYNSGKFVAEAVESALKQTLGKDLYEILVVDDGSTDDTLKILKKYKNKIRTVRQKHAGAVAALNRGLEGALGDYIIILDSDDTFAPEILSSMMDIFKKDKTVEYVYCDYKEVSESGVVKTVSLVKNIFNSVAGGIMFKKKILMDIGTYDEKLIFPEYDVLFKLLKGHSRGRHIPLALFVYRRRKNSMTGSRKTVEKGKKQLFIKYRKNLKIRKY